MRKQKEGGATKLKEEREKSTKEKKSKIKMQEKQAGELLNV